MFPLFVSVCTKSQVCKALSTAPRMSQVCMSFVVAFVLASMLEQNKRAYLGASTKPCKVIITMCPYILYNVPILLLQCAYTSFVLAWHGCRCIIGYLRQAASLEKLRSCSQPG